MPRPEPITAAAAVKLKRVNRNTVEVLYCTLGVLQGLYAETLGRSVTVQRGRHKECFSCVDSYCVFDSMETREVSTIIKQDLL